MKVEKKCWLCGKEVHKDIINCPLWEDAKKITIARLRTMPDNITISIG